MPFFDKHEFLFLFFISSLKKRKMETLSIEILNPKAKKLINDLAELKLINIRKRLDKSEFLDVLKKLRNNTDNPPTLEEIQKEVKAVRHSKNAD